MSTTTDARALTIRQPHASLVAVGAKTIETKSRPTSYRGPLLIHAGKHPVRERSTVGPFDVYPADPRGAIHPNHDVERPSRLYASTKASAAECERFRIAIASWWPLPLGAVVASCDLADCVPIIGCYDPPPEQGRYIEVGATIDVETGIGRLLLMGGDQPEHVSSQFPFGDFSPGRYAWLLGDVKPTTERCPRCWDQPPTAAPGICIDIDGGWWHTPGSCRHCAGACPVCVGGTKRVAPVPMRGRQGLWTPSADHWT